MFCVFAELTKTSPDEDDTDVTAFPYELPVEQLLNYYFMQRANSESGFQNLFAVRFTLSKIWIRVVQYTSLWQCLIKRAVYCMCST